MRGWQIINPESKYSNAVILSDAKNLAFSCCFEILHSVQDDIYSRRVNKTPVIAIRYSPCLFLLCQSPGLRYNSDPR
jgi:hypothetical protein